MSTGSVADGCRWIVEWHAEGTFTFENYASAMEFARAKQRWCDVKVYKVVEIAHFKQLPTEG